MTSFVHFQNQLVSIMEILAKAAVAEINRCVDDSCAVFRLEISQSQKAIETLKQKLEFLERELHKTRRQKTENVFWQDWRFRPMGGENRMVMEDAKIPLLPSIRRNQSRCERPPVKLERLEEDSSCNRQLISSKEEQEMAPEPEEEEQVKQPKPVVDETKPDTVSTPVGDQQELREQHRCGHIDEELSGLEFVVKAEQEEEHVAQRLNQTGSELSAGRLNILDSECVTYERGDQLWTSFTQGNCDIESNEPVCSNTTEQCSQSLSIHSPLYHTPATMEVSGNTQSSFGELYAEFAKMGKELRSEAIHTQQGQYRERLLHTVERENQTSQSQQQQHGPSVKHRGGSESPAQPHSCSQYETGSTLSTGAFNTGKKCKTSRSLGLRERLFVCTFCEKRFNYNSLLKMHQRIHTGEKPYSCSQCGQCFNRKSNLAHHERVHSGYRPFVCTQCGKRFARGTHLREHQRIHAREKPYQCIQ